MCQEDFRRAEAPLTGFQEARGLQPLGATAQASRKGYSTIRTATHAIVPSELDTNVEVGLAVLPDIPAPATELPDAALVV